MSYEGFAYLYDHLMKDVPYDRWLSIIRAYTKKHRIEGMKFLDLACGTGEISVRLANEGFEVTGADLSEDMLSVAKTKADALALPVQFFQQDMTDLQDLGEFNVIGIFCDSLNYLPDEQAVLETFKGVYRLLKKGGLFIFDVHSLYKMTEIFADATFTWDEENVTYIWNCFQGDEPNSVEHELSFFVLDPVTEKYDRIDETHFQRSFPIQTYKTLLHEAGFGEAEVTGDFSLTSPLPTAERLFFATVKK